VWTGHQLLIWGGYDGHHDMGTSHVTNDGAAYDPATDTWTRIPSYAVAKAAMVTVWTGTEMLVLGGMPASVTGSAPLRDAAAYNPSTRTWQQLPSITDPHAHDFEWRTAVMTDHDVLTWVNWSSDEQTGPNSWRLSGGADLFRYDPQANTWAAVPTAPDALPDVSAAFWAGNDVIAVGVPINCGHCSHPPIGTSSAPTTPGHRQS
jgi:N-acetylneuraminic acid mutarotase